APAGKGPQPCGSRWFPVQHAADVGREGTRMSCRARCFHFRGRRLRLVPSIAIGLGLLAGTAFPPRAERAAPVFGCVGRVNGASFGGPGIANDYGAVASRFVGGDGLSAVALSATALFEEPVVSEPQPVGNDGAGVYYAQTGTNFRNGL